MFTKGSTGDRRGAHGRRTLVRSLRRSPDQIRAISQRQLPTDHDCAVPTRGYQSDQPSYLLPRLSPVLPYRTHRIACLERGKQKQTAALSGSG